MLTHLSLFSGIGCSDLAAEWAGFETILMCEIDKDCQKVLRKHWPEVPIIEDVRDVTRESVIAYTASKEYSQQGREVDTAREIISRWKTEIRTEFRGCFEDGRYNGLTLMSAGVPCQPVSSAGKRRGKADDRWLWPEAIRVLSELQPTWAVFENPVGISTLGEYGEIIQVGSKALESLPDNEAVELDRICGDIEKEGYEVQPVSIPACAVEAPHERQRIFIICHTRSCGLSGESRRRTGAKSQNGYLESESWTITNSLNSGSGTPGYGYDGNRKEGEQNDNQQSCCRPGRHHEGINPNSQVQVLEGTITEGRVCTRRLPAEYDREYWRDNWYDKAIELCTPKTKPGVRTVDDGITTGLLGLSRVTKIMMLGNCNPPQLYYPIYKAIADIENS